MSKPSISLRIAVITTTVTPSGTMTRRPAKK